MSDKILYILMRNDLQSLNSGKAMAQASHASNNFIKVYGKQDDAIEWSNETTQGFGTVLVLSVNGNQLKTAINDAFTLGFPAQVITDPTYPYRTSKEIAALIPSSIDTSDRTVSGDQVTLYRSEITCGYIFGSKDELKDILGDFPLHP